MVHTISGVQIFPEDNILNIRIDSMPVHAQSAAYIAAVGGAQPVKAHWSTITNPVVPNLPWGIPLNLATNATPTYRMTSITYPTLSADIFYPIPLGAMVEEPTNGLADHSLHILQTDTGTLYELTGAVYNAGANTWSCNGGGYWNLASNNSAVILSGSANTGLATASGIPSMPGIVNYDEVLTGAITHALRCSLPNGVHQSWVWPAIDGDGTSVDPNYPYEGNRFRLKASFDSSGFSATNQIILTALKTYGAFQGDSGSNGVVFFGIPDDRWNNNDLAALGALTMNNFEYVNESSLMIASASMRSRRVKLPSFSSFSAHG